MAESRIPRMNRGERRRLMMVGRKSRDPETALRFLVMAQLGRGLRQAEVSLALAMAPASVSRIQARFLRYGEAGLYDRRSGNGYCKTGDVFLRGLAAILTRSPPDFGWQRPTWTRELLGLEMERQGYVHVAVCTMGRALARLGARLGSPKPIVLCPWPRDQRLARLAELRRLEDRATAAEPVVFEDEVDIHLNPKIGRDWMLRGHQRKILTPGKNEKFYLAGALDVLTGKLICTGAAHKNAALFCDLLRRISIFYRRARCVHVVLDNYGIHKAAMTLRTLEQLGGHVVLHFLPTYCPDPNRIERVWQDLHANVTRNHRCRSMAALLANARQFVDNYRWRRPAPQRYLRIAA